MLQKSVNLEATYQDKYDEAKATYDKNDKDESAQQRMGNYSSKIETEQTNQNSYSAKLKTIKILIMMTQLFLTTQLRFIAIKNRG